MKDVLEGQIVRTRREALRLARQLGCSGAHEVEEGWMACESPEAFQALLTGGVRAYRALHEKGLVGRAIGGARRAVPNSTGAPKRKKRRVRFDPNATDADADQLVQEGTTAERRVGASAPQAPTARPKRKPATPTSRVLPPEATVVESVSDSVDSTVISRTRREVLREALLEERPFYQRRLDHLDNQLREINGFGRPRGLVDGPHPEADQVRNRIKRRVQRRYGRLETLQDHQDALQKAYPGALINLFQLQRKQTKNSSVLHDVAKVYDLSDEDTFREYFGDEAEDTLIALKAMSTAILAKAIDDPETAKRVGMIRIGDEKASSQASAGFGWIQPVERPLVLTLNPNRLANDMESYLQDDAVIIRSNSMLTALMNRDKIKDTPRASGPITGTLADGDLEVAGMTVIAHEWGHLAGAAYHVDQIPEEDVEQIQEWVRSGTPYSWNQLSDSKHLDGIQADVAKTVGEITKWARTPERAEEARQFFARLGFPGVDPKNTAQVQAVYRALAARQMVGLVATIGWRKDQTNMALTNWKKMDRLSGYANFDAEEGMAELFAAIEMAPDTTMARYADAFEVPEVARRIR